MTGGEKFNFGALKLTSQILPQLTKMLKLLYTSAAILTLYD